MNSGCAPEGIGLRHSADEIVHISTNRRSSGDFTTGLVSPEQFESLSMPAHHSIGLDENQSLSPIAPETGEQDPRETVSKTNLGAAYSSVS